MRHLLNIETCDDPGALRGIERYGLGTARSLADYEAFSGVDFRNRRIDGRDAEEVEITAPPELRRQRNAEIFGRIWRGSGAPPHRTSGARSTFDATAGVRARLYELLPALDIAVLADAGCGDFNWMRYISGRLQRYHGFDVVEELIHEIRSRWGWVPEHHFDVGDITVDRLPECDAILCRDVFESYPLEHVAGILARFRSSGARYLIASTFACPHNLEIKIGGWRPLSLMAPPFAFPPPLKLIPESDGTRSLGVWRFSDLPVR
jgi:hypothetical protein